MDCLYLSKFCLRNAALCGILSGVFILCQSTCLPDTTDIKSRLHIQDKNSCQIRVGLNIFYLYTLYIEQHIKTHNNIQYTNEIQKKVFYVLCSMFYCTLLYVHSSIAIILMGKRELVALLNMSTLCVVMDERLFLAVPQGCLWFVIVVFPDHTHLLFLYESVSHLKYHFTHISRFEEKTISVPMLILVLKCTTRVWKLFNYM